MLFPPGCEVRGCFFWGDDRDGGGSRARGCDDSDRMFGWRLEARRSEFAKLIGKSGEGSSGGEEKLICPFIGGNAINIRLPRIRDCG